MKILTEHMLKLDTNTKSSTGKGILGTVPIFASADEEQGRKTLHQHWQIWVKKILGWEFQFLVLISGTPNGSRISIQFSIPEILVIFF
jgi:hypothetical protein